MRIGMLTGGGDCPGLNAVIRGGRAQGHRRPRPRDRRLPPRLAGPARRRVGTAVARVDPGPAPARGHDPRTPRAPTPTSSTDGVARVMATARRWVDAVIAIGGEDTLGVAAQALARRVAVVGVPKTIDNDLSATDFTFGFHTAVQIATDAIDRLHTTAESHDRVMVVEVMGRHAGLDRDLFRFGGRRRRDPRAGDAVRMEEFCDRLRRRHELGANSSIVVVAEGATPVSGAAALQSGEVDEFGHVRLGGVGQWLQQEIELRTGYEARMTQLGHLLRGGTPTAYDRVIATRFGLEAVDAVHEHDFGKMVALGAPT